MSAARVFGVLRTLERVTRPGHDLDRPVVDDAEPDLTYGYEPGLCDAELIGVRELLERSNLAPHSQAAASSAAGDQHPPAAGHFADTLDLLWLNSEIHALYTHADNEARQSSISDDAYAYWNGRRQALKDVCAQIDTLPIRAPHRNK